MSSLTVEAIQTANAFLDDEKQQTKMREVGESLFEVFGAEKEGRVSTQVRNLQQIVVSASRFSDIEDFVKNQMGRSSGAFKEWRRVGEQVLGELKKLRDKGSAGNERTEQLQLRLHLARGWVSAVVGAYLYAKARKEMEVTSA